MIKNPKNGRKIESWFKELGLDSKFGLRETSNWVKFPFLRDLERIEELWEYKLSKTSKTVIERLFLEGEK